MGLGGGSTTTTTTQELAPEQRQLLNLVIPEAKRFGANPPQLFPKSSIAGFTPLQLESQRSAAGAARDQLAPLAGAGIGGASALQGFGLPAGVGGADAAISGLNTAEPFANFLLSGQALSPETNPFLAKAAEAAIRPLEKSLTEQVLPNIRGEARDQGQFGSSRQGIAEGLALQEFQAQAGDISANVFNQGFQNALAAGTQALGSTQSLAGTGINTLLGEGTRSLFASPQLADLALAPSSILGGVGFQQQQLGQAQLSEEAQRFMSEQILPFLVAQDIAQLAFGIPGGSVTSTADRPGMDPLQALLGFGALGLGIAGL